MDVQAPFARLRVSAGARCIQVFDSWVGALGPDDYVRFVQPYSRALIERIRATGVPVIHFGTGASGFFRELHAAGGGVMGVDWRVELLKRTGTRPGRPKPLGRRFPSWRLTGRLAQRGQAVAQGQSCQARTRGQPALSLPAA